jgi:hypothetical protein
MRGFLECILNCAQQQPVAAKRLGWRREVTIKPVGAAAPIHLLVAPLSAIRHRPVVPVVAVGGLAVARFRGRFGQVVVVPDPIQDGGVVFVEGRLHRAGDIQSHARGHPQRRGGKREQFQPIDRGLDVIPDQKLVPPVLRFRLGFEISVVPTRLLVLDDLRFQSGTDVPPAGVQPDQYREDEPERPNVGGRHLLQQVPVLRERCASDGISTFGCVCAWVCACRMICYKHWERNSVSFFESFIVYPRQVLCIPGRTRCV